MFEIVYDIAVRAVVAHSSGPWVLGYVSLLLTPGLLRFAVRLAAVTVPSDRMHRRLLEQARADTAAGRKRRFI